MYLLPTHPDCGVFYRGEWDFPTCWLGCSRPLEKSVLGLVGFGGFLLVLWSVLTFRHQHRRVGRWHYPRPHYQGRVLRRREADTLPPESASWACPGWAVLDSRPYSSPASCTPVGWDARPARLQVTQPGSCHDWSGGVWVLGAATLGHTSSHSKPCNMLD